MSRRTVVGGVVALVVLAAGAARASTVIGLSVEDQARLSKMVVIGEVIGQIGVDHPGSGIETAVRLRVTDTLKGSARPGQVVLFHTRSGQVGPEISEAVGEAILRTGQKVLVFIESVDGRLYNLGLSMGVWDVQDDEAGGVRFVRALTDGLSVVGEEVVEHGPIAYQDMKARVAYADRNPRFDNESLRAVHGQGR